MADLNDVLKMFEGVEIKPQEDFDDEIAALKGNYVGVLKDFKRIKDDAKDMDFFSMNIEITKTAAGEDMGHRYVGKTFNMGETTYGTEKENLEKLLRAMATLGIARGDSMEAIEADCGSAAGKEVCVKLRPNLKDGKVKRDGGGWPKHIVTIVSSFDTVAAKAEGGIPGF